MVDSDKITRLMQEHETIRAYLKWIDDSTSCLVPQSNAAEQMQQLRERMLNFSLVLSQLKEGVKEHIGRDEQVIPPIIDPVSLKKITGEHKRILQELDCANEAAIQAADTKLSYEKLSQDCLDVKEAVHRLHELIVAHTTREDAVIKLPRKTE
jgi:iron-sulfur cluster repair protein YtfE (RIC family)